MAYNKAKRKSLTKRQRAQLFSDHGGICYYCKKKITANEKWQDCHIIAREFFSDEKADDISNRAPGHVECHKEDTRAVVKAIAKSNRIRRNLDPETRRKPKKAIPKPSNFKWPSRPFPKRLAKDH